MARPRASGAPSCLTRSQSFDGASGGSRASGGRCPGASPAARIPRPRFVGLGSKAHAALHSAVGKQPAPPPAQRKLGAAAGGQRGSSDGDVADYCGGRGLATIAGAQQAEAPPVWREACGGVAFGAGFEAGGAPRATQAAAQSHGVADFTGAAQAAGEDGAFKAPSGVWQPAQPQMVFRPTADGLRLVS